jgi:hypothetical protein
VRYECIYSGACFYEKDLGMVQVCIFVKQDMDRVL